MRPPVSVVGRFNQFNNQQAPVLSTDLSIRSAIRSMPSVKRQWNYAIFKKSGIFSEIKICLSFFYRVPNC